MSEILYPFGATIYHGKASEEFQKFLEKSADLSRRKGKPMGSRLAGNIEGQVEGSFNLNKFKRMIRSHLIEYMQHCYSRLDQYSVSDDTIHEQIDYDKLEFDYGNGPWFNFMKANEFNPLHNHSGVISAVIMIDVPEIIEEENRNNNGSNMPCRGQLEWVYENQSGLSYHGTFKVIPKTGDIFLFPADLKHQVYPFTSDVERITMSFNIHELNLDQ